MSKILVTGGLGYIGSHTVVELINNGYEVVIVDNLSNSSIEVLDRLEQLTGKKINFEKIDLRDKEKVSKLFKTYSEINGVIHFAASKSVSESVENPLKYYENNIAALVYLMDAMIETNVNNFIFSSSCTVYGQAEEMPITENTPIQKAMSPYGNSKKIGEEIIEDTCKVTSLKSVLLRYFNPIGAHESSLIGELPVGVPQNLVPFITQTAAGIREELLVYGVNYPTTDGSAVRDYIHVVDLAKAHVVALNRLLKDENETKVEVFNLGTGKGNTVLEVIDAFEKVAERRLPFRVVGRREGDITIAYANTEKANEVLKWKAEKDIEESILSAWNWEKKIRNIN